jgi:thioredoxin-like negative regulator of GroEL
MKPLLSQEQFEVLIGRQPSNTPVPPFVVVYFTANWCGACKRLDLPAIASSVPNAVWYKCDIDQNDYTAGFCGIRSIPTFLVIQNKNILGTFSESRTEIVIAWLKQFV